MCDRRIPESAAARRRGASGGNLHSHRCDAARVLRAWPDEGEDLRARRPDRLRASQRPHPIEQTMVEGGEPDKVLTMRRDFQRMMGERYKGTVEELTNRKVVAFLSQT